MQKEDDLIDQLVKLFPQYKGLMADFTWCGSFAETDDGLPYIGEYPGYEGSQFCAGIWRQRHDV